MMDPCYKFYHKDGFESRKFLEDFLSENTPCAHEEDTLKFPIECITKAFAEVDIKGDVLIDLSIAPMIHHLYTPCEFFKDLIVLKVSDSCIMELKRWVDKRTGAFDWGHATKYHLKTVGKSDQPHHTEGNMRCAIPHIIKCDIDKENMTDPIVLPPADCVISVWFLGTVSRNRDDYMKYLRKMAKMLKPGGHLVLIGALDGVYYTVGKDKIHYLRYDEEFAKNALLKEGFTIDYCKFRRKIHKCPISVYEGVLCLVAHKDK